MSKQQLPDNQSEIEIPFSKPPSVPGSNIIGRDQQQVVIEQQQQQDTNYERQQDEDSSEPETVSQEDDRGPDQPLIIKKVENQSSKSLQQQKIDLESSNKDSLKRAIQLRSIWRILNLIVITILIITGFNYVFYFLSEFKGSTSIPNNANIFLNVTNCKIVLIDQAKLTTLKSTNQKQNNDFNTTLFEDEYNIHLQGTESNLKSDGQSSEIGSLNSPGLLLYYNVPGRFSVDPLATTSTMSNEVNGSNYSFMFNNILSPESCMIEIHVPQKTQVNNLTISCNTICYITLLTKNLKFNTVNINANDYIEFNAPVLKTQNLSFQGIQGRFQTMYLDFEGFADVRLQNGDIAIQTSKEIMLNFTHAIPQFCLGAPIVANPILIGCAQPPASEIQAFISGVGTGIAPPSKIKAPITKANQSDVSSESDKNGTLATANENFFDDDKQEHGGNIVLIPGFNTYGRSKQYQHENDAPVDSKGSNISKNSSNLHSKTTQQKQQAVQLFQPNCFGNLLLCQTKACATLIPGLKLINESKLNETIDITSASNNASNSSNNTKRSSTKTHQLYRILENQGKMWLQQGDSKVQKLVADPPTTNKTKPTSSNDTNATQTPTDENTIIDSEAESELPHEIPQGIPFLNLTGRFGNLFVNVISSVNKTIQPNDSIVHGSSYANETVNFDIPSRKLLTQYFVEVASPKDYDPTFIIQIGAETTRSDNFQQYQVSFNPAYAYFKPWWIGTVSFTLLSTSTYSMILNLGPGFCPYYPALSLDHIYNTKFLIDSYFKMTQAANSITTLAWQKNVKFPGQTFNGHLDGLRKVITNNNEQENWVDVVKTNETAYSLTNIDLSQSIATQLAVIISIVIAVLVGCILIVGVVYAINSIYLQIITQVASTNKYALIEKKDDTSSSQPLMILNTVTTIKVIEKPKIDGDGDGDNNNDDGDDEEEDDDDNDDDSNDDEASTRLINAPKSLTEDLDISLGPDPVRLFYQLFVLAPPLSAFVDYLCVLLTKKYINSAHEFFTHLFKEVDKTDSDDQLHDLTTESILGSDMKTLYEKFCYLNGFLEQKLDDDENTKALKDKGFMIEVREDAQTESYVNVMLNGKMPKLSFQVGSEESGKTSLQQFIENCCTLSTFEEDNIVVQTFTDSYEKFLALNHLQKYSASAAEMTKMFNITSRYIPQQWVVRDSISIPPTPPEAEQNESVQVRLHNILSSCTAKFSIQPANYVIDRQKMQNHFSLILNHPEQIATSEELALANKELILFGGWYLVDAITVVAHLISTIVFIIPVFGFTLLERILYSPYSLIPQQYLITTEDITSNIWGLPHKLEHESNTIKIAILVVLIYWFYSIIDLLYYYISMQFPQENFFKKVSPSTASLVNKIFRRTMWTLVLISAFFLCVYITLAAVWLMLGAIVNPTAFLPYATAAATFLTVIAAKAASFNKIASDGFSKVIAVVSGIASTQMGAMMKKMQGTSSSNTTMNSAKLKTIASQAVAQGIIDKHTHDHLHENADHIMSNPSQAGEHAPPNSASLQKIIQDPGKFAASTMVSLEVKALALIDELAKIKDIGQQISNIVLAIFKKDTGMFQNNINQLIYLAQYYREKDLPDLKFMSAAVIDLIWTFTNPTSQQDNFQKYLSSSTDCFADLVKQKIEIINLEQLTMALNQSITMQHNMIENHNNVVFADFKEILNKLNNPTFPEIQELQKYSALFEVAMQLFHESGISFHNVCNIIKGFVDKIESMKKFKNILGMIELLVGVFGKQSKALPTKLLQYKVRKAMDSIIKEAGKLKINISRDEYKLLTNSSLITLFFNFLQGHFDNIPKEMMQDIFKYALDDRNKIKEMVGSDKEVKKMGKLIGGVLELVSIFMENNQELTNHFYSSAQAFSIDIDRAKFLNELCAIKYLPFTTFEGSPHEYESFKKLSLNPFLVQISKTLRLTNKVVIGIVVLLLEQHSSSASQDLQRLIAQINNCEPHKVRSFFEILILYTSKNETHLANAAISLSIPRAYIPLILLSKRALNPIYISKESLEFLGAKNSLTKISSDMNDKDYKIWLKTLMSEIQGHEENLIQGGDTARLKSYLINTISSVGNSITQTSVVDALQALQNNSNQFAKLTQNDMDLLQKILALKNIDIVTDTIQLTSDTKQAIYKLATILNVDQDNMEDLINIVFLTYAETVVQSIIDIAPSDVESLIKLNEKKAYVSYLEFIFSHQEKISKKRNFIMERFCPLLPFIQLPKAKILKLIFNKDERIDINAYYQLAFLVIGKNENDEIQKEALPGLNKVVAFLTSTLNSSNLTSLKEQLDITDADGKPKVMSDGQATIISMLNETSHTRAITLFLDYLQSRSKKSKNDTTRDLPQAFHLFSVLYLFFTGHQSNINITVNVNGKLTKQYKVIQYLSYKMDIKPEFFESLHSYFLKDNQSFTTVMVKYMRRQQACDYEAKNPGVKIPLQSLVKIPDQFVLNFINLITGEAYSTSFFAKELRMSQITVDFVALIMKIQSPTIKKSERINAFSMLSGSAFEQFHLQLSIQSNELSNLMMLVFQDYDPQNITPILEALKLLDKVDETILRNLLLIDQTIILDNDIKQTREKISSQLHENVVLNKMNVSQYAAIAKALIQGQFGLTEGFMKEDWQHLHYPDCCPKRDDYLKLMTGLVGSMSGHVKSDINVSKFLRDLYQKFSKKELDYEPFPPNNSIEYAYYQLCLYIQVDPWILMLTQGSASAWSSLDEIYDTVNAQENEFLNPILVLQALLTIQLLPPLHKELFTELEWIQRQEQIIADENFTNYIGIPGINIDSYWTDEMYYDVQQVKDIAFARLPVTKNQMMDAAKAVGMNSNIFKIIPFKDKDILTALNKVMPIILIQLYNEDYEQYEYFEDIATLMMEKSSNNASQNMIYEEALEEYFQDLEDGPDAINYYKELIPLINERIILRVYQEVSTLFIDPRTQADTLPKLNKDNVEAYISFNYFQAQQTPYFNMGLCTTFSVLRKAYWESGYNIPMGEDEHYKVAATHLDYIFTTIERYYHFTDFMDFFSKARAFQLVGLAVGFTFSAENLINANCNSPFVSYPRANILYEMMNKRPLVNLIKEKQIWKWGFLFDSVLKSREQSTSSLTKYFKDYNYGQMIQCNIDDIENEPENFFYNSVQNTEVFNWQDYLFDMAELTPYTELNKFLQYQGQDFQQLRNKSKTDFRKITIEEFIQQNCKEQQQRKNDKKKENAQFSNTLDVRSGLQWKLVYELQKKWGETSRSDNFSLLIDIFKGNYEKILEPDTFFTYLYQPQVVQLLFGLLSLSGSFYKVKRGWTMNSNINLQKYLNSCCSETSSNKKNIAEIISIFFRCFEGMPGVAQIVPPDNLKLLNAFVGLSCQLQDCENEQTKYLEVIIKNLALQEKDQVVLVDLIKTYLGDYTLYATLLKFSSFCKTKGTEKVKLIELKNHMKNKRGNGQPEISLMNQKQVPVEPGVKKDDQKVANKVDKKDGKKDSKKQSKTSGKGAKKFKLGNKKTKKKIEEPVNTQTKYYNVTKLINKILYGLDQSQMHQIDKVDPDRFDLIEHSDLSTDPEDNENQVIIVLWQLACSLTQDTNDEKLCLPLISESDIQKEDDTYVTDFKDKIDDVQAFLKIITNLIKNDYSFFFERSYEVQTALKYLSFIGEDQDQDLDFLKAMIGLKSSKMDSLQAHQDKARKQQKINEKNQEGQQSSPPIMVKKNQLLKKAATSFCYADIDDQIQSLVKSGVVSLTINGYTTQQNTAVSEKVAQLFLGLSSGNVNRIVDSLNGKDSMSASFVLVLDMWKNFTYIIQSEKLMKDYQDEIFPALTMLPLLILSQINEQQDKVKGAPRNNYRAMISDSILTLLKRIGSSKPSDEFRQKIHQIKKANKTQRFSWAIWIQNIDTFKVIFTQYFKNDMKLAAYSETEFLINFMTGKYLVDKFKETNFLKYILELYQIGNNLISAPKNLLKTQQDINQIATYVPSITPNIQRYFAQEVQSQIQVFDQFVRLFVYIQIPQSTLAFLEKKEIAQDEVLELEPDLAQKDELKDLPDSANDKIIKQLLLEVLKNTIAVLMASFDKDDQIKRVNTQALANKSSRQIIQVEGQQIPQRRTQSEQRAYDEIIKSTIYAVMELLTGYDILSVGLMKSSKDKKLQILCNLVDSTIFKQLDILKYMNTTIVSQFIEVLQALTVAPVKLTSNKEFMVQINKLFYLISGQENLLQSDDAAIDEQNDKDMKKINEKEKDQNPIKNLIIIPERVLIATLPMEVITAIFELSQQNIKKVPDLLRSLVLAEGQVKIVDNIIDQVIGMGVFSGQAAIESSASPPPTQDQLDLNKRIEAGTTSPADMFKATDTEGKGTITKSQFIILANRLGMNLSQHRVNEIFSSLQKGSGNPNNLNSAQYGQAMIYLQSKNTNMALDFLGISPALLTISLIFLAIVLLLIFVFIFLGIQAFALGGTFGAVINSLLPISAGGGASGGGEIKDDSKEADDFIQEAVLKSQKIIQSTKM